MYSSINIDLISGWGTLEHGEMCSCSKEGVSNSPVHTIHGINSLIYRRISISHKQDLKGKRFATLESKHVEEWLHAIETLQILSSCLDLKMQITNSVIKMAKEA
jgi:hypothetical protein